jgi:ribokinase
MNRVICLGDVMTDVVTRLSGPLAVGSDTPSAVTTGGGGSAANTACWLAAAGVMVAFVGRVGDDEPGRAATASLRGAGVHLAVTIDPERPTGMCIVLVSDTGERTMLPDAGANAGLRTTDLPVELFVEQTHLHVSGYTLLNAESRPAALAAMALARERGLSISVDAASRALIRAVNPATFLDWLGHPLLIFANADEASELTGQSDPFSAARVLSIRCGNAIVKRGPDGAVWAQRGEPVPVPTMPLSVVDTTGAGDAFAAGFLAAQIGGIAPELAIRLAHTYAARAVTQVGGRPYPAVAAGPLR